MRIAQLAPLAESVPPKLYGGTERVVAWLVDELVALGHDVTLFASGDSRTKGELHSVWPRALRLGRKGADPNAACAVLLEAIARRAKDFDVIHAHIDWLPLPVLSRLGVPFVTTMHGRLDLPGLSDVLRQFPRAGFVSISDHQRLPLPEANWTATIPHGLPSNNFRPSFDQGSYLAFLGRLTAEKGPQDAIRIARAAFKRWKARALHPDVRNCAPPLFVVFPEKSNGDRNEARDRPDRFEHACSHSCGRWHRPCCC